uniref:Elongation of very long chain fatty acids protein n=1 Tax=Lygus hesperus TaxID=30085 RepID=A0A0A9WLP6_LYGHE
MSEEVILEEDDHVQDLFGAREDFVLRTPWLVLSLTASYLYFVLVFGPSFMKTKKPMNLKNTILVYNAVQVAFSTWWFVEAIMCISKIGFFEAISLAAGCSKANPLVQAKWDLLGYWYLISKLVELLDTVFFVLRGKQSQVTFLHVYHHTNMALSTWYFIKYNQGTRSMAMGVCNTFVHIVMYGYYLLAAMGPQVRRHLWWKKYITALQITQFFVILSYLGYLCLYGCSVARPFIVFSSANTGSFLVLFVHFYLKSYNRTKTTKTNGIVQEVESSATKYDVTNTTKMNGTVQGVGSAVTKPVKVE